MALLSELLAQCSDKLPTDAYSNRAGFAALSRCRIIKDAGLVQSVRCEECDQAHDAPVKYREDEGSYGWICYEHGFLPIDRDRLLAFRVSVREIIGRVSASLSCRNRLDRPLIEGLLWRVGVFDLAEQDISVYLATPIVTLDDAQRCAAAISSEPRRRYRVLLTPNLENIRDFDIAGCATARLEDAISIDPVRGMDVRPHRIAQLAGVPLVGKGGRPSLYEPMLSELIEERDKLGTASGKINSEARAIRTMWPTLKLTETTPSESVVKRALRAYHGGS